jgi:hypothetical protein
MAQESLLPVLLSSRLCSAACALLPVPYCLCSPACALLPLLYCLCPYCLCSPAFTLLPRLSRLRSAASAWDPGVSRRLSVLLDGTSSQLQFELDRLNRSSDNRSMKRRPGNPTALDVLFPHVRAALLRHLFRKPSRPRHVREMARVSELALSTVQQELCYLLRLGLLSSWTDGYHRFYGPNPSHSLFESLSQLVERGERISVKPADIPAKIQKRHRTKRSGVRRSVPKMSSNRPPTLGIFQGRLRT